LKTSKINTSKKTLHLPTSTAGFSGGIASIERKFGYESDVLTIDKNKFSFPIDISLYSSFPLTLFFRKVFFFLLNKKKYNVFHFNFGKSLFDYYFIGLPMLDLPFYKGKKVVTFNGSDARGWTRKVYQDQISQILDKEYYSFKTVFKRKFIKLKVKKINKHSDVIFALNPDLFHFLPKKTIFLPYSNPNWDNLKKVGILNNNKIHIVHAPTNRGLKGSRYIINAMKSLTKKYNNIRFTLVENMSNKDAIQIYKSADLFIDQLLIGWYGGVSVEIMKMGKPVAVFIREEDLKFIPKRMASDLKKAIININPFNIESVLDKMIFDPKKLKTKSELCHQYVMKWHSPEYIFSILNKHIYSN